VKEQVLSAVELDWLLALLVAFWAVDGYCGVELMTVTD